MADKIGKFVSSRFKNLDREQQKQMLQLILASLSQDEVIEELKRRYSKSEIDDLIINIDEISLDHFNQTKCLIEG